MTKFYFSSSSDLYFICTVDSDSPEQARKEAIRMYLDRLKNHDWDLDVCCPDDPRPYRFTPVRFCLAQDGFTEVQD